MQEGFVSLQSLFPSVQIELRYATSHNLTGEPLDGYHAQNAYLTREAADAFGQVLQTLEMQGYRVLIYDTYRPQKAVNHFLRWSQQPEDGRTKAEFYEKKKAIQKI